MANSKKVMRFIKECFDELSLNPNEYFLYVDEDKWEEDEWTKIKGELVPYIVTYASEYLGIGEKDILACNEDALTKWLKKYPYFFLIKPFEFAYSRTFYGEGFDEMHLLEVLFDTKLDQPYPTRYNYNDITVRMIRQLKEIDKAVPGTFHPDANITNLYIETENFCHFDEIKQMTECFITMIQNAMRLFLRAIESGLNQSEIYEYNLLVSSLGLRDRFYPKGYLYYNALISVKELYQGITKNNFFDVILFRRGLDFKPWRCVEFVLDEDLVKRYLSVMPGAKREMREFAVAVSQFRCSFTWSDANPIQFSPEEEEDIAYLNEMLNEEPIPLEERAKERTEILVEKNKTELDGDDVSAHRLLSYCRPEKLGGIRVKAININEWSRHLNFLHGKVPNNNIFERIEDDINKKRR